MNRILYIILIAISSVEAMGQSSEPFFGKADEFFKKYVSDGLVNYTAIQNQPSELDSLVSVISAFKNNVSDEERKAFFINAYNILAIKNIVDYYPVKSPQDISVFYDKIKYTVSGEKLTLNEIENNKLREIYKDARFHFVLVCGAKGCPPITNFAYTPEKLAQQMDAQAKTDLNNAEFIRVYASDKKVELSEIFKWYEGDFKANGKSVIQFINQYRTEKIPEDYSVDYYSYDWRVNDFLSSTSQHENKNVNIQSYTPSVLLKKGQWEYKFFNNLYTQTQGYDSDGNKVKYNSRGTYFSSINQFLIGISPKLNAGFDMWIKSVRNDSVKSSPFALLKFENSTNTRTALSGIGPKIKIAPFKNFFHLSIQSTFLFPVAKDQEGISNGKPYLSADSYIWFTQIFYDQSIGSKFQLFFQVAPWVYMKKETPSVGRRFSYSNPVDIFFSYFPTKRVTIYFENEFCPSFGEDGISSWFRQEGIGTKFQIIKGFLEAEGLYTKFTMGKNAGAGETFNLGLRIIH